MVVTHGPVACKNDSSSAKLVGKAAATRNNVVVILVKNMMICEEQETCSRRMELTAAKQTVLERGLLFFWRFGFFETMGKVSRHLMVVGEAQRFPMTSPFGSITGKFVGSWIWTMRVGKSQIPATCEWNDKDIVRTT